MARGTELGLRRLDQLPLGRFRAVHAVARRAGEVAALVSAALPPRVGAAVVTGETGLVDLRGLDLPEFQNVSLGVVVDVRLTGTVTALAAVSRLGSAGLLGRA